MGAEASFHTDDARGSRLKVSPSASRLILLRKAILSSVPKPTTWKPSLPMSAPVEGERCGVHIAASPDAAGVVFADYPRGGSSRSIQQTLSTEAIDVSDVSS